MKSKTSRQTTYSSTPIVQSFLSQNYDNLSRSSSKFTDELFPPNDSSLYSSKSETKNTEIPEVPLFMLDNKKKFLSQVGLSQKKNRYTWKRLSEIYDPKKLNVIKDSKDLTQDVQQGELGDCYFLSALSALAENPERIKKLIPKNKISDKGVYECDVYVHGEPTPVVIDDNVPVVEGEENEEETPAFAGVNPDTNNIWPALLEKAWAKCNMSYEDIVNGNCADAFGFLTPAPYDTYYHNVDKENLFDIIENAVKNDYIVVSDITATNDTNLDYLSKMGLVTNHAYSVIDTIKLKNPNGTFTKLLKMKNNWGTNEWLGDWSDGSKKWTEDYKKQVNLEDKEDGIFWMSYEDFLQFYTSTHICQIHDDYTFISKKYPVGDDAYNLIKVNVSKGTEGYFIVNLKNTRIYRNLKGNDDYENPYCSMIVFKEGKDGFQYIGSDSGRQDRLYVQCEDMQPGTYYVAVTFPAQNKEFSMNPKFEGKKFDKNAFRVGVYTPDKTLKLDAATPEEVKDMGNFAEEVISEVAEKNPDKHRFANEGENDTWRVAYFDNDRSGFGYIYYENNSDAFLRERAKITSLVNVNLVPLMKNGHFPESATKEGEDTEDEAAVKVIENFKDAPIESNAEIIDAGKEVSEKNPAIVQFNVAPHSTCLVMLQKNDEEADIDFVSDITFDYLPNILLNEQKFRAKKTKLRYEGKPIEVFQCITEHNTGVFFHFKNRTPDLRLNVLTTLKEHNNLCLQLNSDYNKEEQIEMFKNVDEIGKGNEEVLVTVLPGQTGFFALNAIDSFQKFSYNAEFEYFFTLANAPEPEEVRKIKEEREELKEKNKEK